MSKINDVDLPKAMINVLPECRAFRHYSYSKIKAMN